MILNGDLGSSRKYKWINVLISLERRLLLHNIAAATGASRAFLRRICLAGAVDQLRWSIAMQNAKNSCGICSSISLSLSSVSACCCHFFGNWRLQQQHHLFYWPHRNERMDGQKGLMMMRLAFRQLVARPDNDINDKFDSRQDIRFPLACCWCCCCRVRSLTPQQQQQLGECCCCFCSLN